MKLDELVSIDRVSGASSQNSIHQVSNAPAPGSYRLGIVRLGRAGGKTKYTLLDEADIGLVHLFAFEARTEIDKNGCGATIYAFGRPVERSSSGGRYIQDILWEKHCGGIAPGFRVVHKNCITVDNRLDNLMLVPEGLARRWCQHQNQNQTQKDGSDSSARSSPIRSSSTSPASSASSPFKDESRPPSEANPDQTLYWLAIQQLPQDAEADANLLGGSSSSSSSSSTTMRYYDSNGRVVEQEDDSFCYYECHHPPCAQMERELREFSICGRCQVARYCGTSCQQKDWPVHKKYCRERRRTNLAALWDRNPER